MKWLFSSAVNDFNLIYCTIYGVTEKQIQRFLRAGLLSGPDIRILRPAL